MTTVKTAALDKKSVRRLNKIEKHLSKYRRRQMKLGCEPEELKAIDKIIDQFDVFTNGARKPK